MLFVSSIGARLAVLLLDCCMLRCLVLLRPAGVNDCRKARQPAELRRGSRATAGSNAAAQQRSNGDCATAAGAGIAARSRADAAAFGSWRNGVPSTTAMGAPLQHAGRSLLAALGARSMWPACSAACSNSAVASGEPQLGTTAGRPKAAHLHSLPAPGTCSHRCGRQCSRCGWRKAADGRRQEQQQWHSGLSQQCSSQPFQQLAPSMQLLKRLGCLPGMPGWLPAVLHLSHSALFCAVVSR